MTSESRSRVETARAILDAFEAGDLSQSFPNRVGDIMPLASFTKPDLHFWVDALKDEVRRQDRVLNFMVAGATALERHGLSDGATIADLPESERRRLEIRERIIVDDIRANGPLEDVRLDADGHLLLRVADKEDES